jgi:hypothetical protein
MTLLVDLVRDDRIHGTLTADATEPARTCRSCKPLLRTARKV